MSNFLDNNSGATLEDVLGAQANTAKLGINQAYAKKKRQQAAVAGASGRLNSGVQNYTEADTNASQLGDLSGVDSALAGALAGVPASDYLGQQSNLQNNALAEMIAKLNKPSALQEALGMIGAGSKVAGTVATFA